MWTSGYLRPMVLLGAPFVLGLLELWHPSFRSSDPGALLPHVNQWLAVHLLQIPLFGLVGLSIYLLVRGDRGWFASISRVSAGVFVVCFVALDAVAGVAVGILGRAALEMTGEARAAMLNAMQVLFSDRIAGGGVTVIGMLGSLAWLGSILAAATALYLSGVSRVPIAFLMLSGLAFFTGHFPPFGPVAMACFLIAVAWIEFAPARMGGRERGVEASLNVGREPT